MRINSLPVQAPEELGRASAQHHTLAETSTVPKAFMEHLGIQKLRKWLRHSSCVTQLVGCWDPDACPHVTSLA